MNQKENKDFYIKLRKKVDKWFEKNIGKEHRWAEYILIAPDFFHLLTKLAVDNEVPKSKKIKIFAAIAYFISPIDLLPEALLGPAGYLDDVALAAYILNDIINDIHPKIIIRNWAGEKDILDLIRTILANANDMLGSSIWQKIKKMFSKVI